MNAVTTRRFSFALAVAVITATVWLRAASTIDAVGATPNRATVGISTAVTITANINDANVIATGVNLLLTDAAGRTLSVAGTMKDDGTSGDQVRGDKVFTRVVTVNEAAAGTVYFRVSAPFKGVILRTLSPVIPVVIESVVEPPTNQAPQVTSTTSTPSVTLPNAVASISGTVTDDGLPSNTLTRTWSKVSGPGGVVFGDASALATTATFDTAGAYV
ncbi:MAG: hypothetical protein ABL961_18020, partial [Vicinamibacterales bacterium]